MDKFLNKIKPSPAPPFAPSLSPQVGGEEANESTRTTHGTKFESRQENRTTKEEAWYKEPGRSDLGATLHRQPSLFSLHAYVLCT